MSGFQTIPCRFEVLKLHDWKKALEIYHPEYQLVSDILGQGTSIKMKLVPFKYPFTVEQIFEYFTAPATSLYLAQMAYVYCYIQAKNCTPVSAAIPPLASFQQERDAAHLRITSQNVRFVQPVEANQPTWASMVCNRFRWANKKSYVSLSGEIGEGIHYKMLCCWIAEID